VKEINGQKVLYFNAYNKYAITTDSCPICTDHINIWWVERGNPVPDASFCWFDIGEMLPTLNEFVKNTHEDHSK
jgi:hypothetical protein